MNLSKMQPLDPKLDREATVNDLRSILDEVANHGGGSLPVTVYFRGRDGDSDDSPIRLSDVKACENWLSKVLEIQIRVD